MGAGIVIIALLVIAGILIWFFLGGAALGKSAESGTDRGLPEQSVDTLRYTPPAGQDPAVVVAALEVAGFSAESHTNTDAGRVVIACPGGADGDRERVRRIIASANTSSLSDAVGMPMDREIRFDDE